VVLVENGDRRQDKQNQVLGGLPENSPQNRGGKPDNLQVKISRFSEGDNLADGHEPEIVGRGHYIDSITKTRTWIAVERQYLQFV